MIHDMNRSDTRREATAKDGTIIVYDGGRELRIKPVVGGWSAVVWSFGRWKTTGRVHKSKDRLIVSMHRAHDRAERSASVRWKKWMADEPLPHLVSCWKCPAKVRRSDVNGYGECSLCAAKAGRPMT